MESLKYTPTPERNILELKRDVVEFTRKLMLIKTFSPEEQAIGHDVDISIVKVKKFFHPTGKRNTCLGKNNRFFTARNFSNSLP